jgi:ADP-heptose:LPS heptosyltransferase
MARKNILTDIVNAFFRKLLSVPASASVELGNPKRFIIIRQHNQLGDLLAGVSLFRAIKECYPSGHITLILSPVNYHGIVKNKFVDRIFIFDKKKLINPLYLVTFIKLIREQYDVALVPVVVSISFTSNLICRLTRSRIRIGPDSLDGKKNESSYFFDRRVKLDWRRHPDSNVSERSLDIVRPFGINTGDYRSEITFDETDIKSAEEFIAETGLKPGELLIGLHVGAGKIQNRWSLEKFVLLIDKLKEDYPARFFLTGSNADKNEVDYVLTKSAVKMSLFLNRKIPEVAALISKTSLFISNDTGIMHVAGATETPQVSIFGPTNPFNWAPIGKNKLFIRKSELIDDVSVQDVFELCVILLNESAVNRKKG